MTILDTHTLFVFFAHSFTLLAALWIFGYPIQRIVRVVAGKRTPYVATPLLGLYPAVQIGWLWSEFGSGGVSKVMPFALAFFALATAGFLAADARKNKQIFASKKSIMVVLKKQWPMLAIFLAVAIGYVFIYWVYFKLPYQTAASLGNHDLPHFAVLAEHLRNGNFDDVGNVYGTFLGPFAKGDVVGTFVLNTLTSIFTGQPVWQTINATLFTGWLLMTYQLSLFLQHGIRVRKTIAVPIALVTALSPLIVFIAGHGYISQLYGTAILLAGATVLLGFSLRLRTALGAGLTLGVLSAVLWNMYPFVVLVMPVLAAPIRLVAYKWRAMFKYAFWVVPVIAGGWLLSPLLAVGRFGRGFHQAVDQSASSAGWSLPWFSPQEILGFTTTYKTFALDRWQGAIPLILLFLIACVVLRKNLQARLALAVIAISMLSYFAIYQRSGVSYQQWKWAGLVAPMLIAASLFVFIQLVSTLLKRFAKQKPQTLSLAATFLVIPVVAAIYLMNSHRLTSPNFQLWNVVSYVSPELKALAGDPFVKSQDRLAFKADPWEGMWLTALMPSVQIQHETYFGYYPVIGGSNEWTVVSKGQAPQSRVIELRPVNSRFDLVKLKPAAPAQLEVLDHSKTTKPYGELSWSVKVTNTDNVTWVSPQDDPVHGLSLHASVTGQVDKKYGPISVQQNGVRKPDPNYPAFYWLKNDLAVQELPKGVRIKPGESYVFKGTTPAGEPQQFKLYFDLSRPDVGNYELSGLQTLADVTVAR